MRWLETDHLGSTSVTANETGERIAELRYKPWGESRYSFGATPTQRRFTGQVLDVVAGCIYTTTLRWDASGRRKQSCAYSNPIALNQARASPIVCSRGRGARPSSRTALALLNGCHRRMVRR